MWRAAQAQRSLSNEETWKPHCWLSSRGFHFLLHNCWWFLVSNTSLSPLYTKWRRKQKCSINVAIYEVRNTGNVSLPCMLALYLLNFSPGLGCRLHINYLVFCSVFSCFLLLVCHIPSSSYKNCCSFCIQPKYQQLTVLSHLVWNKSLLSCSTRRLVTIAPCDVWVKSSEYFWILVCLLDLEVLSGNLIFTLSPCYCCTWPHLSVFLTKSVVTSFLIYMYVCMFLTVYWNCDSNALDSLWDLFWKITRDQKTKSTRTVHALCLLMHLSSLVWVLWKIL
jgi:hypothetical protein